MCIIAWVSCLAVSCSMYFLKSLFHCVGSSHFLFRLPPVVIKHAACSLLSPRRSKHCQTRVMVLQLRGSSMAATFGFFLDCPFLFLFAAFLIFFLPLPFDAASYWHTSQISWGVNDVHSYKIFHICLFQCIHMCLYTRIYSWKMSRYETPLKTD